MDFNNMNGVYSWILLAALICRIVKCDKLDGYSFPVYTTTLCPRNQSEWRNRSSDLNCTESNGYMCIPNENITQLLEFCYRYPRIPIEKDICLILKKSTSLVEAYSCKQFRNGCPDKQYWSNEIFEYPSCLSIGNRCFLAEPLCKTEGIATIGPSETTQVTQGTTDVNLGSTILNTSLGNTPIPDIDGNNTLVWILVIGVFLIILFILVCVLKFIFRRGNRKTLSVEHEEKETITHEMDISGEGEFFNMDGMDREQIEEEQVENMPDDNALPDCVMKNLNDILCLDENSKNSDSPSKDNSKEEIKDASDEMNSYLKQQKDNDRNDSKFFEIDKNEEKLLKKIGNDIFLPVFTKNLGKKVDIIGLDTTTKMPDSSFHLSENDHFSLDDGASDEISSESKQHVDSDRISSQELKEAGIHLDSYIVWKTEMSEKYKSLSNEERAILFHLICSDGNSFVLENRKTLTKQISNMFKEINVPNNILDSVQALQSKGFLSIEDKNVSFFSSDVQDEAMFDYIHSKWAKNLNFLYKEKLENFESSIKQKDGTIFDSNHSPVLEDTLSFACIESLSRVSFESSVKYFRSQTYQEGKFVRIFSSPNEKCVERILTRIISKLGKYILTETILDDKALHSTISKNSATNKCEPAIYIHENVPLVDEEKIEEKKLLSILDFGGQCMYYACHQIYLSKRAFYILVIDMSKNLDDVIDEEHCDQKDSMFSEWKHKDYLSFWLKSVDCYCGKLAPVILVATHAEGKSHQEKDKYYQDILHSLPPSSNIKKHLSYKRYFTISLPRNNESLPENLNTLEKCIVDVAKSQKEWGEEVPKDWAKFEDFILKEKKEKLQSLSRLKESFDELLQLSKPEFADLLRFYHDTGLILYFSFKNEHCDDPQYFSESDVVVVDIQWFINSFKYIVTDLKQENVTKVWNEVQKMKVKDAAPKQETRGAVSMLELIDAATTNDEFDAFQYTGEISGKFLQEIWEKTGNTKALKYKNNMMKYMERLGLMAVEEKSDRYFIPSMNRMKVPKHVKSKIHSHPNKSPILYIRFHVLPVFLFYRLIVLCLRSQWEPLMDGRKCIYIDTAMFHYQNHVVVLGISTSYIQLMLYNNCPKEAKSIQDVFSDVKNEVLKMLSSLTKTFTSDLSYDFGYSCTPKEFGEELGKSYMKEFFLFVHRANTCPLHEYADHNVEALHLFLGKERKRWEKERKRLRLEELKRTEEELLGIEQMRLRMMYPSTPDKESDEESD